MSRPALRPGLAAVLSIVSLVTTACASAPSSDPSGAPLEATAAVDVPSPLPATSTSRSATDSGSDPAEPRKAAPRDERFGDQPAELGPPADFKSGRLALPSQPVFATGNDNLKPESDAILASVAAFLRDRTDVTVLRIECHTDSDGASSANQALSEKRSMAVARWLIAHGTACTRVLPVGFGETKPVANNQTPEGKAQNRRMEFVVAALRGRPVGGAPIDGGGAIAGDPCR